MWVLTFFCHAHAQLLTPIRALKLYHTGYDNNQVQCLVSGFRIHFRGQRRFRFPKNLSTLKDKKHMLLENPRLLLYSGFVIGSRWRPIFDICF